MIDIRRNEIQQNAKNAWLKAKKKGTVEIVTGLGKTFIFLHALYTMRKNDDIHLFLAEVIDREDDLMRDIAFYNKVFNVNVMKDYNLQFYCYQTVYKWKGRKFGLIGSDEIHDSLTPSYSEFYRNNTYDAIIGLSATVDRKTKYKEEGYSKGDLLDQIAPVCFTYNLDQSQAENISRSLNIYVIFHKLDDKDKIIISGSEKKRFYQTEQAAYNYWDKEHKKSWYIQDEKLKDLKIRITSMKRSNILYNLKSKVKVTKELLNNIKGQTILFANSLDSLLQITPNVVSSRNDKVTNDNIKNSFNKGLIKVIGSFKKLKQGTNLTNLDNCVIMSYFGVEKDLIQRLGRLRNNGQIGNVFIIVTQNTQEEVWFNKMFENINNLNLIYCPNVEYCINKYLNGKTK